MHAGVDAERGVRTVKGYVLTVERVIQAEPAAIFDVLSDASKHRLIDGSGMLQGTPDEAAGAAGPRGRPSAWG